MVFLCSAALTLRLHVPSSYMAVHRGSSFAFFLNLSAEDENPIASASCCLTASSQGRFDVLIVCQSLCLKIIQQQYLRICWKKNQVTSNSSPWNDWFPTLHVAAGEDLPRRGPSLCPSTIRYERFSCCRAPSLLWMNAWHPILWLPCMYIKRTRPTDVTELKPFHHELILLLMRDHY